MTFCQKCGEITAPQELTGLCPGCAEQFYQQIERLCGERNALLRAVNGLQKTTLDAEEILFCRQCGFVKKSETTDGRCKCGGEL